MNAIAHPIIRYHGGKFRIAPWIISHFPAHHTYVEPFGGGGSVLLSKEPSELEIYNDLDQDVVSFFRVLRDPHLSIELARAIELTPYSRLEFFEAYGDDPDPIERARRLVIRAQFGYGSAGATKGHTGFRMTGGRLKGTSELSLWRRYPDRIIRAAERFKDVLVENLPACDAIRIYDAPDTLFFVDPPYLLSTRCQNVVDYRHEMTDDQHIELLATLKSAAGKVIISGYSSPLYDELLSGWQKKTKTVQAGGNKGGTRRTECIWISPSAQHHDLFGGPS